MMLLAVSRSNKKPGKRKDEPAEGAAGRSTSSPSRHLKTLKQEENSKELQARSSSNTVPNATEVQ